MDSRPTSLAASAEALRTALEGFDEVAAQRAFDEVLEEAGLEALLDGVVLRYLRELGERWERFEVSIAQEHYASTILRARLLELARGWGGGDGPQAVLACPPDEQHDIGAITFGLALRQHGWRIHFLGVDVPVDDVGEAATTVGADLIVFSGAMPHTLYAVTGELVRLGCDHRVAIGGVAAGAFRAAGDRLIVLDGGAVAEARRVAGLVGETQA